MHTNSCHYNVSYITTHGNKVTDVGDPFLQLTKYEKYEIINMDINYVFQNLLRLDIEITQCEQDQKNFFIFTKDLEVREVEISIKSSEDGKLLIFNEIPYSRLEEILPHVYALSSNAKTGVVVYSVPDLILIKANETYLNFLDEPYNKKENSSGKRIDEIYKDYIGSEYKKNITKLLNTGEVIFCNDLVRYGQDGRITYWDVYIVPIYQNGQFKYFVENYQNVTEKVLHRKHIEEQNKIIIERNKKLEAILDVVSDCKELIDKDGNPILFDELCGPYITKQIMQDKLIRNQVEQIKAVIENMSDAIFIFDNNNNYIFVNKAAREQCPFINNKVRNCFDFAKFYNLDESEVPYDEMPLNLVRTGQRVVDKTIYTTVNDQKQYAGISGTPIFDENNNFIMGVMCSRDITPRIKWESALRDKQEALLVAERKEKEALESAMKIKDEFLANMSHEFKTPLAVINAAIQIINSLYGSELSHNLRKHIRTIHKNSMRQLRLVNNLLDITKYKEGYIKLYEQNLDIVFLTNSIIECIKLFAGQKSVNLEFTSDLESRLMAIDEDKYERILFNLLSNAIKFTPAGKSVYVHIAFENESAVITVRDEGIGIPKEKHEFIFERFGQVDGSLTRQVEGTGIGLSLVKSIIAALEGTISLVSEVGIGSTFTFTIPIKKLKTVNNPKVKGELGSDMMQSAAIEFSDLYA